MMQGAMRPRKRNWEKGPCEATATHVRSTCRMDTRSTRATSHLKAENIPPHFTRPVDKATYHLYSSSLTFIPRISASVPIAFDKRVRLVCMCNVVRAGGCNTERNWDLIRQVLNF
jgi:hypothetical protein